MITLSKNTGTKDVTNDTINQYLSLQKQIPVSQWVILFLNFLLYTVNRFFKTKKEGHKGQNYDGAKK